MRLPDTAHTSRPWRIHEIAGDFRVEDVWALPARGDAGDFPRLVRQFTAMDPSREAPGPARVLWAIRSALGRVLGWDDPRTGVGERVRTLRERVPDDLPPGPAFESLPFESLYLLDDEWAAESANQTMHGVIHLGWVPDGAGGHRGQMAILVKPNGALGQAYMAAIRPFRHVLVYPQMLKRLERDWA